MSTACDHPNGSAVLDPQELVQAFGPTAVSLIPLQPGFARLNNDSGAPVFLSRLACSHFSMTSPTTVQAARTEIEEAMTTPHLTAADAARADLARLLAETRAGATVDPAAVVAAKERISLEDLAEEGRQERAAAALAKEQAEALVALSGPLCQDMATAQANVQEAQDAAYRAVLALLDAVDEATATRNRVVATLTEGGVDPAEVTPPARGWIRQTVVLGESFKHWQKVEYLTGVLNAVKDHHKHRNGFFGGEGRDLGKGVPSHLAQAPRPQP